MSLTRVEAAVLRCKTGPTVPLAVAWCGLWAVLLCCSAVKPRGVGGHVSSLQSSLRRGL